MKFPFASVIALESTDVATLVAVTEAPATTAPLGSLTVPLMAPRLTWAITGLTTQNQMTIEIAMRMSVRLEFTTGLPVLPPRSKSQKIRQLSTTGGSDQELLTTDYGLLTNYPNCISTSQVSERVNWQPSSQVFSLMRTLFT